MMPRQASQSKNTMDGQTKHTMIEMKHVGAATERTISDSSSMLDHLTPEDRLWLSSISPKEEKRIFRKVDVRVISILTMLYVLSSLDKTNIGMNGRPETYVTRWLISPKATQRSKGYRKLSI
jgi:hypothetical protein